jgi:sec-independent protein translocase protein TatA
MSLGIGQILIILVIVLVIFGAGKLPKVMGDLGKGLRAFKEGVREEEEELAESTPRKLKQDKAENA